MFIAISMIFSNLFTTSNLISENLIKLNNKISDDITTKVNKVSTKASTYNYNDLLLDDYSNISINDDNALQKALFYGRILKYYIANSIKDEKNLLNNLETEINKISLDDDIYSKKEFKKALLMQNIIASTINISAYGASSDNEFFAESFAKWLLTPDDQKNRSWEIINDFYTTIMPKLISTGRVITDKDIEEIKTIVQNNSSSLTKYDLDLTSASSNPVDLKYANNQQIGWLNFTDDIKESYGYVAMNYCYTQLYWARRSLNLNFNQLKNLISASQSFMYDSFTKASESNIKKFNDFNDNHFTFASLDEFLIKNSIDTNGIAQISPNYLINSFANYYKKLSWTGSDVIDAWNDDWTEKLKNVFLNLYNYLYALFKNENYVKNVISGLVLSSDSPLKNNDGSSMEGVLGYTSTSGAGYKNPDNESEVLITTTDSYIVIRSDGLLLKQFNSQYQKGWFSSPENFNVIVHEMGHAVEAFGGRENSLRLKNNSAYRNYGDLYSGNYIGGSNNKDSSVTPSNTSSKKWITYIAIGAAVGIALVIVGLVFLKKAKSDKDVK
ncbi:hypothetical protein STABA_v1c06580 [Spiroplasma tabanidicola]|uniref:Uncharacterized protein n=2 Tax=Spiroplasma tabanidicola TaxID=324079 RepID=A0A6I6C991_9MOLU|nr:hypothetical protein STABA_v1c06580 [Spiroplasma tabanidicola]